MRLLVFSDVHGNIDALMKMYDMAAHLDYDKSVFLGDIFGYYYHQKEVLEFLREKIGLIWLKGNHDVYAVNTYRGGLDKQALIENYGSSYGGLDRQFCQEEMDFIDSLPVSVCIRDEDNKKIGLFHGCPERELEGRLYPRDWVENPANYEKFDIVIQGHTHWRMSRYSKRTWIVNPGSIGQPRDGRGFGFAIVDTKLYDVKFYSVNLEMHKLFQEIERRDPNLKKLRAVLQRKAQWNDTY